MEDLFSRNVNTALHSQLRMPALGALVTHIGVSILWRLGRLQGRNECYALLFQ